MFTVYCIYIFYFVQMFRFKIQANGISTNYHYLNGKQTKKTMLHYTNTEKVAINPF